MEKLLALMNLFRKGQAVDNAAAWKNHQVTATMVGVVIMALVQVAKAFGYELPIDDTTATAVAGGLIAAINVVLTYITSSQVGVLQPATEQPVVTADTPVGHDVPASSVEAVPEAAIEHVSASYLREAVAEMAARNAKQFSDSINSGA